MGAGRYRLVRSHLIGSGYLRAGNVTALTTMRNTLSILKWGHALLEPGQSA